MNSGSGVLCSGSIIYDIVVKPFDVLAWGTTRCVDSIEYHVGGNGANTSRALAILGTRVKLLGAVGNDAQSDFILEELRRSGIDTTDLKRSPAATATTVVLVNESGNRQFLHRLGSSEHAFKDALEFTPHLCAGFSHYHFASLFLLPHGRKHAPVMLERARNAGLTTSLDTNWDATGQWMEVLKPCLPYLDILFMNEDEALRITGSNDPAVGAEIVSRGGVKTAVMKLGARGCAVYHDGKETLSPAFAVDAKDTTGAGDCFVAGFLDARQRGASWAEAARFGNAVGALSVQKIGAVTGVVARDATERWMDDHPNSKPAIP